ncbi:hypothetical protein NW762_010351 [Fusarium torreyae]|uniref:Uncharacterized protein n=1 Tax=Fusarium torreyae TaxID=1237075 RepID=A0A9W8RW31_9HYPO|nr:hypothetical protein NW762_010351 [Fusarium torreyae]
MGKYTRSLVEDPLEVLRDTLIAGVWDDNEVLSTTTANKKMTAFCQWLDDWVYKYTSELQKAKQGLYIKINSILREFVQKQEKFIVKIQKDYSKLRTTYPHHPWSKTDRKTIPDDRKVLATHSARKLQIAQILRSVFATRNGTIILAPAWAEVEDVVMLVKGGKVSYVFAPRDEDLKRRIPHKEKCKSKTLEVILKKRIGHKEAQEWDADELQSHLRRRKCYMLTREAYMYESTFEELEERYLSFSKMEVI